MKVEDILAMHTWQELSDWAAYEEAYGPIDHTYTNEMLAQIHELLQGIQYLTGAAVASEDSGNPASGPKPARRAGVLLQPEEVEPEVEELTPEQEAMLWEAHMKEDD